MGRKDHHRSWLVSGLWALLCLLSAAVAQAQSLRSVPPLTVREERPLQDWGLHVEVLEDRSGAWTLDTVLQATHAAAWQPVTTPVPSFGYRDSALWLRVVVHNLHPTRSHWELGLLYPLLDYVDLYVLDEAGQLRQHDATGDRRPFASRPIPERQFYFGLKIPPQATRTLYLRVQSGGSLQLPLVLTTPELRHAAVSTDNSLLGLYGGAMLAMLLYNLLLYVSLRDPSYLYYVGYLALFGVAQLTMDGVAFQYLWPNQPEWGNMAMPLSLAGTALCVARFARSFLDLKTLWPRADVWIGALQWLFAALIPGTWWLGYATALRVGVASILVAPLVLLGITVVMLRRGHAQARYFLLAFTGLMLGVVLYALHVFSVVPQQFLTTYGLQIGSGLEFILLSFALAHRLKLAQDENTRLQQAHAQELESRVQSRTQALDRALHELTVANAQLQELTVRDALTGLHNRQYLDEHLPSWWRHAQRWKQPMSMLMLDLDHFKQVNDTYGHAIGDEALKAVAEVIGRVMGRPGDQAIRYGGEEFLIVLLQTHSAGAAHIAERIRAEVEALSLVHHGQRIALTVSIGVACVTPGPNTTPQALLHRADQLLYLAKHQGRNRCTLQPSALEGICIRPEAAPAPASSAQT